MPSIATGCCKNLVMSYRHLCHTDFIHEHALEISVCAYHLKVILRSLAGFSLEIYFVCEAPQYPFFKYPVAFQLLPLCSILMRYEQKRFAWSCSELLWFCLNHNWHLVPPTVVINWRRSLYSYSVKQPPTVTRLCTIGRLVLCPTITKCPL